MDDVDSRDFDTKDFGSEDLDELVVYGQGSAITPEDEKPIPFDDSDTGTTSISHSPLNLGGSGATKAPQAETPAQPARPRPQKPTQKIGSSKRITGAKTFFTKLHPGALTFLDEQITNWLKNNPGIEIKRTNTVTGEIQGKKTEPNIIITIWY